ncbi:MAG: hypothetical protein V3W20_10580 [Candidatus Neomarinimicrobiota bacterium]
MSSSDNNFCVSCPTNCLDDQPVISCNDCITEFEFGQVEVVYWTNVGNPLADSADFALRVDNAATADPAAIRALCVKGIKPAPDQTETEFSCDTILVTNRTHTLDNTVDKLNTINYEALKQMQCGGKKLFWFTFRGQKNLYGGLTGIVGNFMPHFESAGDGKGDILLGKLMIKWDSLCDPDFIVHPSPGIGCN